MSREEEIITLQQFLRFGETKSIVELMAIQEKEGQAVTVPSSKADSGIRTFIESNSRARSPGLLSHLESSSPSSIHHFENIPNSLAFLLPFQYISPMSAPMLGLPPNGLTLEQSGLARMREAGLPGQSETVESSESEVSLSPFCGAQSPSRGAVGALLNPIEPKIEPNRSSPVSPSPSVHTPHTPQPLTQSGPLNNHQIHHHFDKNDQSKGITHSSFSSKMHRMRRMGATSRKGRVCCNSCGKTFYDKGTLKIHYNAVHLKIKHRCTIEGCNMVFSSLRSRNRHSANPNPRLHMPMLRNNRDKDLIRSGSGTATPVISSAKSGFNLTSPGRPSLGFATPPLEPLHFPSLKSVQPVQPVPPFYRTLLSPANLVSPPVSLPNSPILPNATTGTSLLEPPPQMFVGTHHSVVSECTPAFPPCLPTTQESSALDHAPKKKPRKSSMPVKIEKDVIDVAEDYEDRDEYESEDRHSLQPHVLHNNLNGNCNNNNNSSDGHRAGGSEELSPCQDALRGLLPEECEGSTGGGELHRADSFTSEDQDHERDFENESETSEARTLCRDELVDAGVQPALFRSEEQGLRKEEQSQFLAAQHQPLVRIKEEASDPTYDMFCMGQYSLYNGSMAALHESFITSMGYGTSPTKFPSHSPDSDICSDPKICYVCKKSFKSSYSVKLHYKNVHLKEMHVCTVAGCNAAFPSRRSRDRHSSNINLHRKLLTKELDELILDPQLSVLPMDLRAELLAKVYGQRLSGGRAAPPDDDYVALDLSTASSVQSSGSLRSWRDSDEGSDEGVLLDEPDASSDAEDAPRGLTEEAAKGGSEEGLLFRGPSFSPSVLANGVVCGICQKMYSNRGTLRVHYKTVHLREMHKCKVQGCNVMFSSVRSRNRHSQNPNLHKNVSG